MLGVNRWGLCDQIARSTLDSMIGRVLFGLFVAAAVPICLAIGALMGYFLLLILYLAFELDFPTGVTIGIGVTPIAVSFVSVWWVSTRRGASSAGSQTPRTGTPTET